MAKSAEQPKLVCWMSDIHVPYEDKKLIDTVLKWCRDQKPDVVVLGGDILDVNSCSSYTDSGIPSLLVDEVAAGNSFLDRVQAANPNADFIYLEGNHERRAAKFISDKAPSLNGALTLQAMLHLKERGIRFFPYGHVHFIGKLGFTHGTLTGQQYAAAHLRKYGCSLVLGHMHKFQTFTQGIAGDKVRGVFGMGCLCPTTSVPYIDGPSSWQQGFGAIHVAKNGSFWVNPIIANEGKFLYGNKMYG